MTTSDEMVTKIHFDGCLATTKADLETRIEATKAEIFKWMFGQTLAIIGVLVALLRFGP